MDSGRVTSFHFFHSFNDSRHINVIELKLVIWTVGAMGDDLSLMFS